ncbi:MAG: DUF1854 domain-containing protein [Eubacteriales bacterium]
MADNQENGKKSAEIKTDEAVSKQEKDTADKKENTEKDGKEVKTAEKSEEAKKDDVKSDDKTDEKKDILDEIDGGDGDLILENQRESVPITPKNARFYRSKGNLISLELTAEGKEPEMFERVVILRSFPVTNPDEFLSVREPDTKKKGRGKEIGMIRRMSDFDEATSMLFLEELDRRYFSPQLLKIISCKEKFGYSYWDAETTAGHVTFILNNPFYNIRVLEDGRIFINDIDGNSFEIPDPKQLDPASFRKIEIYL